MTPCPQNYNVFVYSYNLTLLLRSSMLNCYNLSENFSICLPVYTVHCTVSCSMRKFILIKILNHLVNFSPTKIIYVKNKKCNKEPGIFVQGFISRVQLAPRRIYIVFVCIVVYIPAGIESVYCTLEKGT